MKLIVFFSNVGIENITTVIDRLIWIFLTLGKVIEFIYLLLYIFCILLYHFLLPIILKCIWIDQVSCWRCVFLLFKLYHLKYLFFRRSISIFFYHISWTYCFLSNWKMCTHRWSFLTSKLLVHNFSFSFIN